MDLESEAAQRVGTTLCNKWTLDRLLGTGGMAAVYVATHKIGRRDAIKILHADVARDPELRARFEQEAHAVNRFKHPGTVEVRDIDVAEDGSPFLVMELLDGCSLAELARRPVASPPTTHPKPPGGVPLSDLLRFVDETLDVLAAAHAQGIIHRDIKPDNLFVLEDGRLKVLDFGIARVRQGAPVKLRTRVGAKLGTAPYMPPEQIRGVEIDARADLFAVGATMFRLIAGRHVHEADTEPETLLKMVNEPAPPLASVVPDVPSGVALVVDRALRFDREQRYPDALTMQGDVRALREGRPPPYATAHPLDVAAAPLATSAVMSEVAAGKADKADDLRTAAASPGAIHTAAAAAEAAAVVAPVAPAAPGPERTLQSVQGLEGAGAAVTPQGYVMATAVMPQAVLPVPAPEREASASSRSGGPRTQLSGVAPSLPLAPGESIPVLSAPSHRRTLPGTEIAVLPLVLVGVVFAAIGVGVTLWLMLSNSDASPPPATPQSAATHPRDLGPPHAASGNLTAKPPITHKPTGR